MLALCRPEHHGSTPKGTPLKFCPKWPTLIDLSVGDIRSQIAAEWLQIAQRSQWRAYRKPPSLFRWCQSWPPTTSPSPKWGFHMPPRYANGHIFATVRPIHFMWCLVIGWAFRGRRIEWRKTSCELVHYPESRTCKFGSNQWTFFWRLYFDAFGCWPVECARDWPRDGGPQKFYVEHLKSGLA